MLTTILGAKNHSIECSEMHPTSVTVFDEAVRFRTEVLLSYPTSTPHLMGLFWQFRNTKRGANTILSNSQENREIFCYKQTIHQQTPELALPDQ